MSNLNICDVKGDTYEEKLNDAGLTTLKTRRRHGDLIETFKTIKGINTIQKEEWFDCAMDENKATRGNTRMENGKAQKKSNILRKKNVNHDLRKNFFTNRVINDWNGMPEETRSQKTLNAFKNALDIWLKKQEEDESLK